MNNIIVEIQKSNNIVLLCHKNPDGDAVGSVIAMYHLLKKLGKNVDMVIDKVPDRFNFIKGYERINELSVQEYDLGIILDTASRGLINDPNNIVERIKTTLIIDHHISNTKYGDINYIENYPACCEIVYNLVKEMNIAINKDIAIPLCAGLLTDTGGLSHPNVMTSTYQMAADLSKIVNIPEVHKKVLGTITKKQFELKKLGITNLEFYKENQITFTYITEDDLNKLELSKDEADILSNVGREIKGVEASIFIRKYKEGNRVSLRSSNINVSEIAINYGGGGHKNASGILTDMAFEKIKEELIKEVGKKIDEWNISSK